MTLLHRIPNVIPPYASAEGRVSASQALLYVINLKCHTVGGQPVSSQVSTIRPIGSRFAPVFRDCFP